MAFVLTSCRTLTSHAKNPVGNERFIGSWHGNYYGGVEKIEITSDGNLNQEFSISTKIIYKNTAHWKYVEEAPSKGYLSEGIEVQGMIIWLPETFSGQKPKQSKQNAFFGYVEDKVLIHGEDYIIHKTNK
jgi:hypothetical protein